MRSRPTEFIGWGGVTLAEAKCPEFLKFVKILKNNQIKYKEINSDTGYAIARVRFWYNGNEWSVMHGYGTYGGATAWGEDKGLLEILHLDSSECPIGFLTAEEAWREIRE